MTSTVQRRVPAWVWDVAMAAGVAVAGVLPSGHQPRWAYPLAFAAGVVLVLRRRFPRLVLLATFPALIGQLGTIAAGAALYSLGRARPGYRALLPWVAATAAVTVLPVAYEDLWVGKGEMTWGDWVVTVLVVLLISVGPAAAGALVTTRMQLAESLAALRAAEEDRDRAVAAGARAEERSRIARDVHDIVGHYASLIAVQASALESKAPDEDTRQTSARLRELSSRALDEMRSAVTDWAEQPEPPDGWTRWVLQPALAASLSGVDVRIEQPESLPAGVGEPALRALRRVVQEGVTNAVKHCPGASVQVSLGTDGSAIRVVVRNEASVSQAAAKGGSGLIGLTDRIGPLGGSVEAGRSDDGHWVLDARVPASAR